MSDPLNLGVHNFAKDTTSLNADVKDHSLFVQNGIGIGVTGSTGHPESAGIRGFSFAPKKGLGVQGTADGAGGTGVSGDSTDGTGVSGVSGSGTGISGVSTKGIGVHATSDENHSVFGDAQNTGLFRAGCYGITRQGWGVAGFVTQDDPGEDAIGVFGQASFQPVELPTRPPTITFKYVGMAGLFNGPVSVLGNFHVWGAKSAAVKFPDGSHRLLYSTESPESWFEDFGEAKLVKGRAKVKLPRDFTSVIKPDSYHVFVSAYGDCDCLYVSERTPKGFIVAEHNNGKSNVTFSYRFVARRKDIPGERFAKIALPKLPKTSKRTTKQRPVRTGGSSDQKLNT